MDLQAFFDYCRGLTRDNFNSGEFTNTDLAAPFRAAWAKVNGILAKNRAPVMTGWVHVFVPAYGSMIPLNLYGFSGGVAQAQHSIANAWATPTGVVESINGVTISVDATAPLIAAGLVSGKSVLLTDFKPSTGLSGAYTVSLGDPVSDQSLLIPGYRIRQDAFAELHEADIGLRARVVYCAQEFSPLFGTSAQQITQSSTALPSYANLTYWNEHPTGWALTNGGIQIPVSTQDRVIALRGVYGIEAPTNMSEEIPAKLEQVLAHATLGYSTRESDPQTSMSWLTAAFGPGMGDTEPHYGFMDVLLSDEMQTAQGNVLRPDAAGLFFQGQP